MANSNKSFSREILTSRSRTALHPKGMAVAKIGIAINQARGRPRPAENERGCLFVDVDAFGRQAEVFSRRPNMVQEA
jgi:hypothetical protein